MPRNYVIKKLPRMTEGELKSLLPVVARLRMTGKSEKRPEVQHEFNFEDSRRGNDVRGKVRR